MTYQAVLFDLDGTLLDTLADLTASTNAALAAFSMPRHSLSEVRRMVGNGLGKLIERAVPPGTSAETREAVLSAMKAHYALHALDATDLYPQAAKALAGLKAAGLPCAVVSNKADFGVQALHRRFFEGLVRFSFGEREGFPRKPDPALVKLALDRLEVPAREAVYVGDSEVDAATARNAGLDCILVDWGFRERTALEAFGFPVVSTGEALLERILDRNETVKKPGSPKVSEGKIV